MNRRNFTKATLSIFALSFLPFSDKDYTTIEVDFVAYNSGPLHSFKLLAKNYGQKLTEKEKEEIFQLVVFEQQGKAQRILEEYLETRI